MAAQEDVESLNATGLAAVALALSRMHAHPGAGWVGSLLQQVGGALLC